MSAWAQGLLGGAACLAALAVFGRLMFQPIYRGLRTNEEMARVFRVDKTTGETEFSRLADQVRSLVREVLPDAADERSLSDRLDIIGNMAREGAQAGRKGAQAVVTLTARLDAHVLNDTESRTAMLVRLDHVQERLDHVQEDVRDLTRAAVAAGTLDRRHGG